ncbi:isoprenylcysteine carboxylmethyltransferase family protein [Thermococcus aggregans]|uniref:Isoprenylcysteine carboxylmethyltransferase family protein n=1 Tax=Thermococcus aggregans TaxID=110163 RepID=A0A9E7SNP4_THEAG|nr:isoprenylcysteine carboxylmethyltransferase family protein [Thermococcus aggregans]USS40524.1 isoprenylcysteine carboxylmethyltransferase family protein [Thermococcus aggregans]
MVFLGIVPKVFLFAFPYTLLAFYLNSYCGVWTPRLPTIGALLVAVGIALWLFCYTQISRAYRRRELLTSGCYSRVRHPIYSIWGLLILPGFSLVIGGFMLGLLVVYWTVVMRIIGEEEKALEERFDDEWREHTKRTSRFLPRV